ncbi:hypothetical protein ARMSODRAFT_972134 [Armillaria solidipes]|uniref:Uncharacterized protein n=1 Tax=Armillaria solidipes TaxID=1076256 RepID=A0A2H3BS86_9AGAR|nr:hypothetical protein ARMSODRAFT_972134 [Armillaria solidipes]
MEDGTTTPPNWKGVWGTSGLQQLNSAFWLIAKTLTKYQQMKEQTMDPKLLAVISSPNDVPFPCMDRGFLDLGPDLCLDGCKLVEITDERRLELGFILKAQHIVKQWFPNNLKNKRGRAILGMKLKANLRHPSSLQHVYSHLLYDEHQIGTKVMTETEKLGVSHNNINIINQVTGKKWEKESADHHQAA